MYKKFILVMLLCLVPVNVFAITPGTKTETVVFNKCVDGDTARFMRGTTEIKARFLAIDTPETVHPSKDVEAFGKEASDYTCERLKNAKKIVLEYDPKSDEKDKYDRYLVWVYVDDVLLQNELIEMGYAKVAYLYGDYLYTDKLKDSEEKAKNEKTGLWGLTAVSEKEEEEEEIEVTDANEGLIEIILNFFAELFDKLLGFIDNIIDDVL